MFRFRLCCMTASIIGIIVMGCHLFLGDGVSHPTHVLTISAAVTLAGLIGNAVGAFMRLEQKGKTQRERNW